jgi:hypothetical protein
MTNSTTELKQFSFRDVSDLKNTGGYISADIAAWINIERPGDITNGRLFIRYFSGTGYRTIELDKLLKPVGSPALLSARASIPAELLQAQLSLCVEINGSSFKVDTVNIKPILEPTAAKAKKGLLYAA